MAKLGFLSMIIAIIFIPTRLSKGGFEKGPQRAVMAYLVYCGIYYGLLRVVLPRI